MTFFNQSTPIHEIQELNIGSRPARRASGFDAHEEDLRAIPYGGLAGFTVALYSAGMVRIRQCAAPMAGKYQVFEANV